jgi:damage-control phosphatase, subfamily III
MQIPKAPLLRGIHKNSFAFETISIRFPTILTKIIDCLLQNEFASIDKSALIRDISQLKYQISRNLELPSSDLTVGLAEKRWFDAPWLFVECLMYLVLYDYVAKYSLNCEYPADIFMIFKTESLLDCLDAISQINTQMLNLDHFNPEATLQKLILISLWGNRSDLSLNFNSLKDRGHENPVIVDDSVKIIPKMMSCTSKITFVLDNAGFELYGDLCLAEYLTENNGCNVVFEAKAIPWFVSDTTRNDFDSLFEILSRESNELKAQVDKWKGFLQTSTWAIRANKFWTTCKTFWELPDQSELFTQLIESEFIIFKGDLNYRKVVHDANWPCETTFKEAIGPLSDSKIPPFVMLRTCKADTCVGLTPGQDLELYSTDKNWMKNGKFGMIQSYF